MSFEITQFESFEKLYEKAIEKLRHHLVHPDEEIVICSLDEVHENLGGNYGRVKILNDIIYLHPESTVDVKARITIAIDIYYSLPKYVRELFNNIFPLVPIFNRFACGSIHYKYPDFNFFKGYDFKNLIW